LVSFGVFSATKTNMLSSSVIDVYLFSINFNEGPSSTLTFVALKSQSAIKVAPIALKEAAGKDVEATHFLQYKLFFHLDN